MISIPPYLKIVDHVHLNTAYIYFFIHSVPVVPQTPRLTVSPADDIVETGTSLSLTCVTNSSVAQGQSHIAFNFYNTRDLVTSQSSDTLTVSNVTSAQSGNYTCDVTIHDVTSRHSNGHVYDVLGEISCTHGVFDC